MPRGAIANDTMRTFIESTSSLRLAVNKASESIVANITAICEGREPSILSSEEIDSFVKERVSELHAKDEE